MARENKLMHVKPGPAYFMLANDVIFVKAHTYERAPS